MVSEVTAPAYPSDTCYGVCCSNGNKSLTLDSDCFNNGFNGVFTLPQNVNCPSSPVIIPFIGCSFINQTGIFNGIQQCTRTTTFGYNNTGSTRIIPRGVNNFFINGFGTIFNQEQTQTFLSGYNPNTERITVPCDYDTFSWNISSQGFSSIVTSPLNNTCESYCCNSTYCITTTDPTCSMITSGTVKWGGWGTTCANGQPINSTTVFPCPCTADTNNNAGCGKIGLILFTRCTNGTADPNICIFSLDYNNTNTESYTVSGGANNKYNITTLSGILTTTFLPGYHQYAENVTYYCNMSISRYFNLEQTFANR
jgi:hypothetical protein